MQIIDQRAALERLIEERREDYAGLSRLIGRNAAYIHQFIKRGSPRKLDEKDRRTLARYFGVSESVLGGTPAPVFDQGSELVRVSRLDVRASAGPGTIPNGEAEISQVAFDPRWLRQLCRARPEDLSFIRVTGDSMYPTLADGDDILVDQSDGAHRLRDGIYVMRRDDALMVKRVAANPATRRVTIQSDNPAYPAWHDCEPANLGIIGRVVWVARRMT
jgi:phage repressor protein C with HTH and peptisase S24 domain